MDAPIDFTLDRARLLSASSLGTYDTGFNDVAHSSTLGRTGNGSASVQELARVGTPSSISPLGQYSNRYLPPNLSLGAPGAGYTMMNSFLAGGGGTAMGDHLKSLLPDLQQYWNAHADGCARYIVNNNTIYSPSYLPYLPGTDSLSLFAQNVGVGSQAHAQAQAAAYHRIYDLHKEAMFAGVPHGTSSSSSSLFGSQPSVMSPPSSKSSAEVHVSVNNSGSKKENINRHSDTKRTQSDSSKHSAKSVDSHPKGLQSGKQTKDSDKKHDIKKSVKAEKRIEAKDNNKVSTKSDSKVEKPVSILKTNQCTGSSENCEIKVAHEKLKDGKIKPDNEVSKIKHSDESGVKSQEAKTRKKLNDVKSVDGVITKEQNVPTLTTVTYTSSESVNSTQTVVSPKPCEEILPVNNRNGSSPETDKEKRSPGIASTSTTFSLPYYHAIYSHSQPVGVAEGKKVHAPTFTPEIGTLPSVVSVTNLPVQTTACDMRIKKEKSSYSCCKGKCVTSSVLHSDVNKNHQSENSETINVVEQIETKKTGKRTDVKESKPKKKSNAKEEEGKDDKSTVNNQECERQIESENKQETKEKNINIEDSICKVNTDIDVDDEKRKLTEAIKLKLNVARVDVAEKSVHDKERKGYSLLKISNSSSDTNSSIEDEEQNKSNCQTKSSPVTTKFTITSEQTDSKKLSREMTPHDQLHTIKYSQLKRTGQSKLSDKVLRAREISKKGSNSKDNGPGMNIPIGIAVAQKREDLKEENADQENPDQETRVSSNGDHRIQSNGTPLHRLDGQPSAFTGSTVTKPSSPSNVVADMRNTLPANLIVTGSATGSGIAWSDDPAARHFNSPWLHAGHSVNPSWMSQMPFPLPSNIPTSGASDPSQHAISVPPGYKLVQDSVTGQLMFIQTSNLDMYDHSRLWAGGFPSNASSGTFQQLMAVHQHSQLQQHVLAQHPERQPPDFALAMQQYQQQLQSLYQQHLRQEIGPPDTIDTATSQPTTHSNHTKNDDVVSAKEIQPTNKLSSPSNSVSVNDSKIQDTNALSPEAEDSDVQNDNHSAPLPSLDTPSSCCNDDSVQALSVTTDVCSSIKTVQSIVQSRSTSPMVAASEIDDSILLHVEETPIPSGSCNHTENNSQISTQCTASVQTSSDIISCCPLPQEKATKKPDDNIDNIDYKDEVLVSGTNESTEPDPKQQEETSPSLPSPDAEESEKVLEKSCSPKVGDTKCEEKDISDMFTRDENANSESKTVKNTETEHIPDTKNDTEFKGTGRQQENVPDHYNPFLDPQLLQAADGLELLSTLAEKRSKCIEVNENKDGLKDFIPLTVSEVASASPVSNGNLSTTESKDSLQSETFDAIVSKMSVESENTNPSISVGENKTTTITTSTVISSCVNVLSKTSSKTNLETPFQKPSINPSPRKTKSSSLSKEPDIPKPRKVSRTRSIPAKAETEPTLSYYTSSGLPIPQDLVSFIEIGEEEINAIELDMRIRLSELQRLYKEKQKQLAKLHTKRKKEWYAFQIIYVDEKNNEVSNQVFYLAERINISRPT